MKPYEYFIIRKHIYAKVNGTKGNYVNSMASGIYKDNEKEIIYDILLKLEDLRLTIKENNRKILNKEK